MPVAGPVVPRTPFEVVSRRLVFLTRPALEKAGYRCECCKEETGLRVVTGCTHGGSRERQTVVLCGDCRAGDGFRLVCLARMRKEKR